MTDKQITIVVAVIRNDRGDVLLGKRNSPDLPTVNGNWELIGGGIELGETPEAAIIREVKEEAGVDVEIVRLLPKIFSDSSILEGGLSTQVLIISYECKITGGELAPGQDQEIEELKFVPLDEVKNYKAFNNIYQTVELLKNSLI